MNRRMTKGMFHWIGLAKFSEQQQPQWQAVGEWIVWAIWVFRDDSTK